MGGLLPEIHPLVGVRVDVEDAQLLLRRHGEQLPDGDLMFDTGHHSVDANATILLGQLMMDVRRICFNTLFWDALLKNIGMTGLM